VVNGNGALTQFFNNSSGGSAHFVNNGGTAFDAAGGVTQFLDTSTAGNATFTNNGNTVSAFSGFTRFRNSATAGSATFNNNGGGFTYFGDSSDAGSGTFNSNGGMASNGNFGYTQFSNNSSAAFCDESWELRSARLMLANPSVDFTEVDSYRAMPDAVSLRRVVAAGRVVSYNNAMNDTTLDRPRNFL
jgi:hypothetical protein